MKVTLVRHGITEWNALRRFQGQTDVELSLLGRVQARAIGKRLRDERFAACVASDLQRARETAQLLLAEMVQPPPLRLDADLREIHFGLWEGLTFDEVDARWPKEAAAFRRRDRALAAPPSGETWSDFDARVVRGFERARDAAPSPRDAILLVVHGGVIHALLRRLVDPGERGAPVRVDPAGVTELEIDGDRAWTRLLNDRAHLDALFPPLAPP